MQMQNLLAEQLQSADVYDEADDGEDEKVDERHVWSFPPAFAVEIEMPKCRPTRTSRSASLSPS